MVEPVSHSADGDLLVVRVLGGEWGYCFALVRRKTGAADVLFDVYEGVAPEDISPKSVIHYKAGDGLDIPAYLTVPRARGPGPLPLVVLPHGGPFARDEPGFDWWAQALASQGYVVLQPQFRGSSGLGLARLQAGYGEYGRKMQTDLSDGVAALAHQGLIDPTRVAIDGGSYGGYAALAGVALQSGVYRCAVSLAGPANVRRQLDYMRERSNGSKETIGSRYWRAFLGVASDADPKLDAVSPDLFAASVQAPVLLIHGLDDTVVPYDQSQRMERALKKAGKEVRFVTLKGEDHWLSRSETRLEMLKATTDFLKSCNPA
jgi:dipeptidyl aminopeptidase/acylaminoacyl peptidase